jgi:putative transposase
MDKNSLSHTRWECKYHLVFAPKYRCIEVKHL